MTKRSNLLPCLEWDFLFPFPAEVNDIPFVEEAWMRSHIPTIYSDAEPRFKTGVIIGAHSVPAVTARMVYLMLFAGVKRLFVKCPNEDERRLVVETMKHHAELTSQLESSLVGCWSSKSLPSEWYEWEDIEDTVVVAYGGQDAIDFWKTSVLSAHLIEHGPKISFGIIPSNADEDSFWRMAGDFTDYLGSGCMSPRRYFVHESHRDVIETEFDSYMESAEWVGSRRDLATRMGLSKAGVFKTRELECKIQGFGFFKTEPLGQTSSMLDELMGFGSISYYQDLENVVRVMSTFKDLISTVGWGGSSLEEISVLSERLGDFRTVYTGDMQHNDFWEPQDGIDEIRELTRSIKSVK